MSDVQRMSDILPIDGYRVQRRTAPSTNYVASLTHLYQPIVGIEAISLYHLLLQESFFESEEQIQTHHTLMNYLNVPLYRINEARLKLEAIGLLKTYREQTDDRDTYTYVVQAPFSPERFFQDVMLAELLFRQIGEQKFSFLKRHYTKSAMEIRGENITTTFEHVFSSVEPSESVVHTTDRGEKELTSPQVPLETSLDFTLLQERFRKKRVPLEQLFTEKNKTVMTQLAVIYDLSIHEIEKALEWALTDRYELDIDQFKKACHDIFRMKENVIAKSDDHNVATKNDRGVTKEGERGIATKEGQMKRETQRTETVQRAGIKPKSKVDKLIERFETASPKQVLEDLSSGRNASEQDMLFIRDLMLRQGLPAPVMNVLIHFVMLRSDMKLPRNYMETVASNWSRKKFKTAKEAFLFARKQMKKRPERQQKHVRKQQHDEVLPEWFKNRGNERSNKKEERKVSEKEQAEIVALLEKYAQDK